MSIPLRVGIIGCGNIAGIYLRNLAKYRSTAVLACSDLDLERAAEVAEEHGIPNVLDSNDLLVDPGIDLVLNLTVPKAHSSIAMAAVEAGKHVYNEKPLTIALEDALQLNQKAKEKGVLVGCAPDTFLGAGIQTCRALIDRGELGDIVACEAHMQCHGHESWHPAPEFYYEQGGGPMLDMGPYYITALVNLMGGIKRVAGISTASFATRTITSEPKRGNVVQVETPTHITGSVEFESGAVGVVVQSFDIWHGDVAPLLVHGSEGSLRVGDPNQFGDHVQIRLKGEQEWRQVQLTHGFAENSRGLGVLDMAHAIEENRAHRASGELATHVLEVMNAFTESSVSGQHRVMATHCRRPEAMAVNEFASDIA
jgi:predicted dehydrogenase